MSKIPNNFVAAAFPITKYLPLQRMPKLNVNYHRTLMQPEDVSDDEWLGKCVRTIEESVPNEQDRKDLLASTSILAGLVHDINFVQTFIPEEIMRQSSVVKEIIRKERTQERAQGIISVLEVRFGEVDDTINNRCN